MYSDEKWFVAIPYLILLRRDAIQENYTINKLFGGVYYMTRSGIVLVCHAR